MKVQMLVEDRDCGYIILDGASVPEGSRGMEVDLQLCGIGLRDLLVSGDDDLLWVVTNTEQGEVLHVGREQADWNLLNILNGNLDNQYPIPACEVFLDFAEYEAAVTA